MGKKFTDLTKRLLACALSVSIGVSACAAGLTYASADGVPTVTTDKSVYKSSDETCTVTYENMPGSDSGSDYRWYGIYNSSDTPGAPNTTTVNDFWGYFYGESGTITLPEAQWNALGEGSYKLCMFAGEAKSNDAYIVSAQTDFTISDSGEIPSTDPVVTMNKPAYKQGEAAFAEWKNISGSSPWYGIYKSGEATVGTPSTIWAYISAGSGSTDFSDAQRAKWEDLTVGKYILYIFADDDASHILAQVDFEIKAAEAPDAPVSVAYSRTASKRGLADGTVTITDSEESQATGYALYWGDENGRFENYAPFAVAASGKTETSYSFLESTVIPSGATRLYAYSQRLGAESEEAVFTELPEDAALNAEDKAYLKFAVMSELHVTDDSNHIHNKHLDKALKAVKELAPDNDTIVFNGDLTDGYHQAQYDQLKAIVQANSENLPEITYVMGNHELLDRENKTDYATMSNRFKENFDLDSVYYTKEFKDCTFIALGSEIKDSGIKYSCSISNAQFAWLEEQLEKANDGVKPIFLFLHQPLKNTTSGSLDGQGWDGVSQDARMRKLLKKYPQVTMFTGHTHWELEARQMFYNGKGTDFNSFNDGAIGYLWTDDDAHKEGSQGLFVEVYGDKIVVKGYDYDNNCWISAAQFMVDLSYGTEVQATAWTSDKATMLENKELINKAYVQLSALGEQKGGYTAAFDILKTAKETLDAVNGDIYTLVEKLDALKTQTANKAVNKTDLDEAAALFSSLSEQDKEFVPNAQSIIDKATSVYQASIPDPGTTTPGTTTPGTTTPGTTNPVVTNPANGPTVVNGKTVLYKDGKAVTGTKIVTVSGKTYAVVGGYVKTGRKNQLVKIGSKSYVVNKTGVVVKGPKNKLVKVGSKSYIVNKKGVVVKGAKNKLVKVGKKKYIVNKKGVVQKNKKSVKVGKKTYRTNKKGVATLKKK